MTDQPLKYDFDLDPSIKNNSHSLLLRQIPQGARVLELGCATGYMSRFISEKLGCDLVGVDIDSDALQRAATFCRRTIRADVEDPRWWEELAGESFDIITCADILEHLKDPASTLRKLASYLGPNGRLLASIPNIAHASIRLELLEGRFTYQHTGLMDNTHLRFFTYATIGELFANAGWRISDLTYTYRDLADSVIEQGLRRAGLEPTPRAKALLHSPEAAAYQFVVSAQPAVGKTTHFPATELSAQPLEESLDVFNNLHDRLHRVETSLEQAQAEKQAEHERAEHYVRELEKLTAHNASQHENIQIQLTQIREQNATVERLAGQGKEIQFALERTREHLQATETELEKSLERERAAWKIAQHVDSMTQQVGDLTGQVTDLHAQLNASLQHAATLEHAVAVHLGSIAAIQQSTGWRLWMRLTLPLRAARKLRPYAGAALRNPRHGLRIAHNALRILRRDGLNGLRAKFNAPAPGEVVDTQQADQDYQRWITECEPPPALMGDPSRRPLTTNGPKISILLPVYNVDPRWLLQAVDSVKAQLYPNWQLCIADDASPSKDIKPLLERLADDDPRIRVVFRTANGHISAASNSALELAEGDWLVLLDHDDLLAEDALLEVVRTLDQHPEAGLIYSDEDKIDEQGRRFGHYFKPDFNPDLMLSQNVICHLAAYRADLVREVGGFREGLEGAQDYDLALRVIERIGPAGVRHIPRVLYHWRAIQASTAHSGAAKPYTIDAAISAVSEHLARTDQDAEVEASQIAPGMLRIRHALPSALPLVSLIIPTRNGLHLLRQCIDSIVERTHYTNYEIVVADNNSDDPAALEYLAEQDAKGHLRVVRYVKPFNFSAINNFAVRAARGDLYAFLNNDLEVINADWLDEMVSHALRPAIGAVGARLWYPDDTLQHAGVVLGIGGVAGHAMKMLPKGWFGYNGRAVVTQNYSAVTAACLVIKRGIFEEVGGFNEQDLAVAFNDVDFCLRVRERGYRNLWTPHAELYHHESATRGYEDTPEKQNRFRKEIDYMERRWGEQLLSDPAYNPNLSLVKEDFSLNWDCRHGD